MYHAVTPVDGRLRRLGLADGLLHAQLTAIDKAGFALLGLTEALDAWTKGDKVVALTFDDAYADFLATALPTLEAIGAKATVYVPTDHVGANARWLGSDQYGLPPVMSYVELRNCVESGLVEVGSHGHKHVPLDTLSPSDVSDELQRSKSLLESNLGITVRSLCYPHGYHSRMVRDAARLAGYDNACEVGRRLRSGSHRFAISRLAVSPHQAPDLLLKHIRNGGPRLVPAAKRMAQPAWRQVRQHASRGLAEQ
jgi:peptidoglycan/xylan/chitin deacetylase (PgdA/CDA1 family)